ncbi:MAG: response regulator [Porphyrobacter sp.]|nr:response regulator [Porphyrobacter sp.]
MPLKERTILVVEDEFLLARDLTFALEDAGAVVIGPVPSVERAMARLAEAERLDGAVLDISVQGETVFPVADLLCERHVPFVFATGYEEEAFRAGYREVAYCPKPIDLHRLVALLGGLLKSGGDEPGGPSSE